MFVHDMYMYDMISKTVWSRPTLAQHDCAANFASEFTAQPAPEARPGRWGLGRARLKPDPTRICGALRGDAASNPWHQSPLCGRVLWGCGVWIPMQRGIEQVQLAQEWYHGDLIKHDLGIPHFHSGQKFWEGPTPFYPQLEMTRHVGFAWVWAKIADPMQTNSMDIQCYTHTQMEENRGPNAIQFHGYPMLHPYPNGIETYWEHTATG